MEVKMERIAGALQEVIRRNVESTKISSGNAAADEAYTLGVTNVVEDLEVLLTEITGADAFAGPNRPYIPDGFRIHSVVTH